MPLIIWPNLCGRLTFLHSVDHSGSTTINETGIIYGKRSRETAKCMKSDMNEGKAHIKACRDSIAIDDKSMCPCRHG